MTLTMSELRQAHPMWFAKGNAKHHGDLGYRILHSKHGTAHLVRHMWNDRFSDKRIACWRINPIGANLEIQPKIADVFDSLEAAKAWLTKC